MSKKEIEWSDSKYKKMLIEQRRDLWNKDTIEMLSKWFGLHSGMKVADIGCGLGYLGLTFWEYFGDAGSYTGVDKSQNLVTEAKDMAKEWSQNGNVNFIHGDVYNLPLDNDSYDVVMCQTLLMHLEFPDKALQEMKRILKSGGLIVCIEPDNLCNSTRPVVSSLVDESLEDLLLRTKIYYYRFKGYKKLGYGDFTIGSKLPKLLSEAGFSNIDARAGDKIRFTIPPYGEDMHTKAKEADNKSVDKSSEKDWKQSTRRDVLAGGGTEYLLRKYFKMNEKYREMSKARVLKQIEEDEYYSFSFHNLYVAIGRKE